MGVELIRGTARFTSPEEIVADGRYIKADRFVIATGSKPAVPDIKGLSSVPYMTSDEALEPDQIPESLIVVGGRGRQPSNLPSSTPTWVRRSPSSRGANSSSPRRSRTSPGSWPAS